MKTIVAFEVKNVLRRQVGSSPFSVQQGDKIDQYAREGYAELAVHAVLLPGARPDSSFYQQVEMAYAVSMNFMGEGGSLKGFCPDAGGTM